jgi:hypothetical protein
MAFFRTAVLSIKEVIEPCEACKFSERIARNAIDVNPEYLYTVVSGLHGDEPNDNGDQFRWEELLRLRPDNIRVYATWNDKPNLTNHDMNKKVGRILDAWPIKGEKSIDMLVATEKKGNEWLWRKIESGKITDVSMGASVDYSYCSECEHLATNENEWCLHLHPKRLNLKGRRNPKSGNFVYEDNRGVTGMEVSWITFGAGADPKAKQKVVIAKRVSEDAILAESIREELLKGAKE